MRLIQLGLILGLAACSNDVDPRVIPGGGVGDGEIDGTLNVHVIDTQSDAPIGNAMVRVGDTEKTTNEKGLAVFGDLSGKQTIAVKVTGYRSTAWVGVNGANVTIPVEAGGTAAPPQATLAGTIAGWDQITVPAQHLKAAIVLYSHVDDLGDDANSLDTPTNQNVCVGMPCNWRLTSRTGTVTIVAAILDRDSKGTLADPNDDTQTIIGWAYKAGVVVEAGINQMGFVLDQVEAGNLQNVTVDLGTPPAALTETSAFVGIETSSGEIVQLPLFLQTVDTMLLAPKPSVFDAAATYRLTAVAQTASGESGAQSILLRRGLTATTLAAGTWLVPPTGVSVTRTAASFTPSAGAKGHNITWSDGAAAELLEISIFDGTTAVDVPSLVALPASGTLTAKVGALGVDFDVTDFSLDEDRDQIWGVATEPTTVP